MGRAALLALPMYIACSAMTAQADGFYAGVSVSDLSTDTGGFDGDGSSVGVVLGYRGDIGTRSFWEGELEAARLNGDIDFGAGDVTEFNRSVGVSLGLGTYFAEKVSGSMHVSYLKAYTDDSFLGSQTDDGFGVGFGLSYDVTERDTLGLRVTRTRLPSDNFADTDLTQISLRYLRRF